MEILLSKEKQIEIPAKYYDKYLLDFNLQTDINGLAKGRIELVPVCSETGEACSAHIKVIEIDDAEKSELADPLKSLLSAIEKLV